MYLNRKYLINCTITVALFASLHGVAQTTHLSEPDPPKNWHAMDLKVDGYFGISLKQAYDFLQGKKSNTVIVGIVDSGIDTLQKDLQGL